VGSFRLLLAVERTFTQSLESWKVLEILWTVACEKTYRGFPPCRISGTSAGQTMYKHGIKYSTAFAVTVWMCYVCWGEFFLSADLCATFCSLPTIVGTYRYMQYPCQHAAEPHLLFSTWKETQESRLLRSRLSSSLTFQDKRGVKEAIFVKLWGE